MARDMAEELFQAVDTLINKRIEKVRFDETVEATVKDDAEADRGKYVLTTGDASFVAYSASDTKYRKGEAVLVTIPQGDFDKQKMIIGRQTGDNDTAKEYISPLASIVDATGNLIYSDINEIGIKAQGNENQYTWEWDLANKTGTEHNKENFIDSAAYKNRQNFLTKIEALDSYIKNSNNLLGIYTAVAVDNFKEFLEYFKDPRNIADAELKNKIEELLAFEGIEFEKASVNINDDNFYTKYFTNDNTFKIQSIIWDSGEINESGFTRIGLAAKFKTFLDSYKLKTGTYGVMLEVSFTAKEYEGENKTISKFFPLDSSDFFGNIYGFNSFIQQEIAYDISGPEYENFVITRLRLYGYQRQDFFDKTGTSPITNPEPNIFIKDFYVCLGIALEDFKGDDAHLISLDGSYTFNKSSSLLDNGNLLEDVKDLYNYIESFIKYNIYSFYNSHTFFEFLWNFNNDQVYQPPYDKLQQKIKSILLNYEQYQNDFEQMSVDKNSDNFYYKQLNNYEIRNENNTKKIFCRWIHKNETSKVIKALMQEELPEDYEIRWYRYKLGLPSVDAFGGAHWDRFYSVFQLGDDIQYWKTGEDVIVAANEIGLYEQKRNELANSQEYNLTSSSNLISFPDDATNKIQINFIPNPNYEQEQFKAVILKKHITNNSSGQPETTYSKVTESNIITFINNDRVRNPATYNDENALSIKAEDGTFGSYLIYDRAGQASKGEDKEIRTLTAVFDINQKDVWKKPELNNFTSIEWWFPTENTMIIPLNQDQTGKEDMPSGENLQGRYGRYFTGTTKVSYVISPTLDRSATNNTVRIEVVKDGLPYTAYLEMIFGTAGTSGSDYTIDIRWDDKSKAVKVDDNNVVTSLEGTLVLYDSNNYPVDIPRGSVQFSWDKVYVGTVENNTVADIGKYDESVKEEDNSNLYYPIIDYPLTMNKNKDPENPVADRLIDLTSDYYFTNNNSSGSVEFNLEKKIFEASTSTIKQLYRKRNAASENKKSKLVFKPIETTVDGTFWEEGIKNGTQAALTKYADGTTLYFWNQYRRCFVKVDNYFIIDPWDSYQEAETYYYPVVDVSEKTYTPKLLTHDYDKETNKITILKPDNSSPYSKDIYLNSLHILKVTISNFGDYDLIAYFPIPIKYEPKGLKVDGIVGPTYVRYSVSGEVDFDKNPYGMFIRKQENGIYKKYEHPQNVWHEWKLIYEKNNTLSPAQQQLIYPNIKKDSSGEFFLEPLGVYFKDAVLYGVQYYRYIRSNNETKEEVLWTQPILVYQDNYPSTTLNKWNGKDILTKKDSGIIVANGFAAGKKEFDNTFTGVVLGDWSREEDTDRMLTKETGVFGFNHGAMSYALKDDGTAFFGKDGRGRIYLNGNKAQIYSSGWIADKDDRYGMFMDIDDGKMEIIGQRKEYQKLDSGTVVPNGTTIYQEISSGQYVANILSEDFTVPSTGEFYLYEGRSKILLDSSQEYFSITHPNGKKLIEINGNGKYYLQSQDFSDSDDNKKGVKFDLGEGKLTGYDFTIEARRNGTPAQTTLKTYHVFFKVEGDNNSISDKSDIYYYLIPLASDGLTYHRVSGINAGNPLSTSSFDYYILKKGIVDDTKYQAWNIENPSDIIEVNFDLSQTEYSSFAYSVGNVFEIVETSPAVDGGKITISSSEEKPLQIGTKFWVNWDGELHAENADVSGNITANSVQAVSGSLEKLYLINDGYIKSSQDIEINNSDTKLSKQGFYFNGDGTIYANQGWIGGIQISQDGITSKTSFGLPNEWKKIDFTQSPQYEEGTYYAYDQDGNGCIESNSYSRLTPGTTISSNGIYKYYGKK